MLRQALSYIQANLNEYLHTKEARDDDAVVLDNVAKIESWNDSKADDLKNKVIISLVNVVEEKTLRNGPTSTRLSDNSIWVHNPAVRINIYLLFCAHSDDYNFSLQSLSRIITFFQKKSVFTPQNSPGLDAGIEKIIFELESMNFEQLNHLWGVLGGNYIPSTLYKVRLITLMELPETSASIITSIEENEKSI